MRVPLHCLCSGASIAFFAYVIGSALYQKRKEERELESARQHASDKVGAITLLLKQTE
jgi:hypothetical protein